MQLLSILQYHTGTVLIRTRTGTYVVNAAYRPNNRVGTVVTFSWYQITTMIP